MITYICHLKVINWAQNHLYTKRLCNASWEICIAVNMASSMVRILSFSKNVKVVASPVRLCAVSGHKYSLDASNSGEPVTHTGQVSLIVYFVLYYVYPFTDLRLSLRGLQVKYVILKQTYILLLLHMTKMLRSDVLSTRTVLVWQQFRLIMFQI